MNLTKQEKHLFKKYKYTDSHIDFLHKYMTPKQFEMLLRQLKKINSQEEEYDSFLKNQKKNRTYQARYNIGYRIISKMIELNWIDDPSSLIKENTNELIEEVEKIIKKIEELMEEINHNK